jgi:hypothetical protein
VSVILRAIIWRKKSCWTKISQNINCTLKLILTFCSIFRSSQEFRRPFSPLVCSREPTLLEWRSSFSPNLSSYVGQKHFLSALSSPATSYRTTQFSRLVVSTSPGCEKYVKTHLINGQNNEPLLRWAAAGSLPILSTLYNRMGSEVLD